VRFAFCTIELSQECDGSITDTSLQQNRKILGTRLIGKSGSLGAYVVTVAMLLVREIAIR